MSENHERTGFVQTRSVYSDPAAICRRQYRESPLWFAVFFILRAVKIVKARQSGESAASSAKNDRQIAIIYGTIPKISFLEVHYMIISVKRNRVR
jgi:hypothetical protein